MRQLSEDFVVWEGPLVTYWISLQCCLFMASHGYELWVLSIMKLFVTLQVSGKTKSADFIFSQQNNIEDDRHPCVWAMGTMLAAL